MFLGNPWATSPGELLLWIVGETMFDDSLTALIESMHGDLLDVLGCDDLNAHAVQTKIDRVATRLHVLMVLHFWALNSPLPGAHQVATRLVRARTELGLVAQRVDELAAAARLVGRPKARRGAPAAEVRRNARRAARDAMDTLDGLSASLDAFVVTSSAASAAGGGV